ncbi:MAG: RdgB/HAM1 family non-canonical purine NTP pyrophosphatase [Tannerella sp.]|jgi:XTP/dITP diphosphohydrolase|nr:RdgB/HAM1 family non-canonical purine NTP pyrophosphatase [Tannerella sp.]
MKKMIFATNNAHKLREVRAMMPDGTNLVGLPDLHFSGDLPETADTLEGNALQKARFVSHTFGHDCFADDTGLEVTALDGRPGVHSARYAGDTCNSLANIYKLLDELSDKSDRSARFRTVIALILDGEEYLFDGAVNGHIIDTLRGGGGFGYDSVFVPVQHVQTFAELGDEVKNTISHRARAVAKLAGFLSLRKN